MNEHMDKTYLTASAEETEKIGLSLASEIKEHTIIALCGELGAGKTTFVQGFAKGLGLDHKIISPTFIIVRSYTLNKGSLRSFYHIDLYRIEEEKQAVALGLLDILQDTSNIVLIEWAEKIPTLLPKERIDINFKYLAADKREITVTK